MLMYADDTVLFYSGKVAAAIEKSLNLDLIGSWLHNVTFKSRCIKWVFEFKYLRVVFDEYISWNSHVKYVFMTYYPELENDWECQHASGESYIRLC